MYWFSRSFLNKVHFDFYKQKRFVILISIFFVTSFFIFNLFFIYRESYLCLIEYKCARFKNNFLSCKLTYSIKKIYNL